MQRRHRWHRPHRPGGRGPPVAHARAHRRRGLQSRRHRPVLANVGTTDEDVFTFDVTGSANAVVQARTSAAGTELADTKIYFCNETATTCTNAADSRTNKFGYDNDSGPGRFSLLTVSLALGKWHLIVEPNSTTQAAADDLVEVTLPTAVAEVEPNTATSPTLLDAGSVGAGAITSADTLADFWKLDVTAPGSIFIQTRPANPSTSTVGNLDTQIGIGTESAAQSSCAYLTAAADASNDGTGPFSYSEFTYAATPPGAYFVGIQRYGSTSTGDDLLVVDRQ